jgi:hypothetical protein
MVFLILTFNFRYNMLNSSLPGNQAANGGNKPQPKVSEETDLLGSLFHFLEIVLDKAFLDVFNYF